MTVNMSTSNMEFFREGYFFGQKKMIIEQKLDVISDMLKVLDEKNVLIEHFVEKLNSIKGKLFEFTIDMIALFQKEKDLTETELKYKLNAKKEELTQINFDRIVLDINCKKLL